MSRSPFHLIVGDDDFAVVSKAREIIAAVLPEKQRLFGLEVIEAVVEGVDQGVGAVSRCRQALDTPSFLEGGRKVVWLRNARFLGTDPDEMTPDLQSGIEQLVRTLGAGVGGAQTLIITSEAVHRNSPLLKAASDSGEVHEFGAPRKENQLKGQARERLIAAMREKALRPDEAVVERLLERVGYDARQIEAEVEKLSLYLGSRRDPSEADVLAIVSFSRGLPGWELAEAAGRRDLPGAMVALTHLMAQGASVIGIAASLAARFRELLIYNVAVQEGWLKASSRSAEWGAVPAEVEALLSKGFERDLRKTHAYRMAKLVEQAEAFSREELGRCLEMIQRAHEVLVTSDASERLVLELLLIKMLRRQEGERRGDALDSTAVCGIVSAACAGQESVS